MSVQAATRLAPPEDDPEHPNRSRGAAGWLAQQRQESIRLYETDVDERIRNFRDGSTGSDEWTYKVMHRAAQTGREVAYWEGVRDAARR